MDKETKKTDKITSEKIMSDKVKIAILSGTMKLPDGKKLKCDIAIREMGFKNCQFDVIGYNKNENTVYVFECKLGTNITSVGQAFGQILGYKSVLEENGYEFLSRFYEKYHEDVIKNKGRLKIKLEDWTRILNKKKMNFRFFVVLKDRTKEFVKEIISIKRDIKPKIGVLSVTKEGICTPHLVWKKEIDNELITSDKIEISLVKKYKRDEFFDALEEKLKSEIISRYPQLKTFKSSNVVQFKLYPNTHYELWVKRREIEIGFHIEANNRYTTEKIFSVLLSKQKEIKRELGKKIIFDDKWGQGWTRGKGAFWAKIYEEIPRETFDEEFLDKVCDRIKKFIDVIQPILENE